jgi:hypothetical protein
MTYIELRDAMKDFTVFSVRDITGQTNIQVKS